MPTYFSRDDLPPVTPFRRKIVRPAMEAAIAAMEGFNMEDTPIPSTTKSQLWGDITDPRCETWESLKDAAN